MLSLLEMPVPGEFLSDGAGRGLAKGFPSPTPPCPLVGHGLFLEPPPVSVEGKKLLAPYLGPMGDGEEIQGTRPRFLDGLLPSSHLPASLCLPVCSLQALSGDRWNWVSWESLLGEQEASARPSIPFISLCFTLCPLS